MNDTELVVYSTEENVLGILTSINDSIIGIPVVLRIESDGMYSYYTSINQFKSSRWEIIGYYSPSIGLKPIKKRRS